MLLEDAKVLGHERLKGAYYMLRLHCPGIAVEAEPGQFAHLRVPALEPTALRRPFSICDADPATGTLDILYKQVGRGTRAMESLKVGDSANLMGPLGNSFPTPGKNEIPVFVAGGFGVAPLLFLAKKRKAVSENPPCLFVGGKSADDILLADEFAKSGVEVVVCTEDASAGEKGYVTVALDKWLDGNGGRGRPPPTMYCCGPDPLLKAVDERARARGLTAWLSLDRRMGCAVGACLGCVVKMRDGGTLRVCKDGPVFKSGTVGY